MKSGPLSIPECLHAVPARVAFLLAALLLAACGREAPAVSGDGDAVVDTETPAELRSVVTDLMPRLERLSGLDRREPLRVRRQSRADARAYVEARLREEMPEEVREGVRRTYVALGLIADTLDLDALLLDLYTEQVLGYYDPTTTTLYVVEGADAGSLRPVLAHELVHALQDQHSNLDSLVARERGNDRQTAAHAALEGHAMLVMFAVLAEQAAGRQVDPAALPSPAAELGPAVAAQNEEFPVFRRAPAIIQETVLFPYLSGAEFVHRLWGSRAPMDRYPAPLDSLLPQSTEQVMRPHEAFIDRRDPPIEPRFDSIPPGWRAVYENNLGQFETSIFLSHHLGADARSAADGWAGDRYVLLSDDDGNDVLQWVSVWDTPAEADRFAAAARRVAARRPARSVSVTRTELDGRAVVQLRDAPHGVAAAAPLRFRTLPSEPRR